MEVNVLSLKFLTGIEVNVCHYNFYQVWRLSWNVTGTVLCSSGDDGCVRLWKGIFFYYNATIFFFIPL